tara:strand:+ start:28 stop:189 length:162 start_codon:yes stop_codon:yes gene_type:complete
MLKPNKDFNKSPMFSTLVAFVVLTSDLIAIINIRLKDIHKTLINDLPTFPLAI